MVKLLNAIFSHALPLKLMLKDADSSSKIQGKSGVSHSGGFSAKKSRIPAVALGSGKKTPRHIRALEKEAASK